MKYLMLLGFAIMSFCMGLSALMTNGWLQEIHLNWSQGWQSTALIGFVSVLVGIIIISPPIERYWKKIEEEPSLLAFVIIASVFFSFIIIALLWRVSRGWVELADIFISLIFVVILSNQYYGLKTMKKFFTFRNS